MNNTLTRDEIASSVANQTGLNLTQSNAAISAVIDAVQNALKAGRKAEFRGFGSFSPKTRKARIGRNPRDPLKTPLEIPAKVVVKFKAGVLLNQALNAD